MAKPLPRPELTFPSEVAAFVTAEYQAAATILEYGTGGSTVLASELPGKKIFAVESDPKWLCALNSYIATSDCKSLPITWYADIGATGAWGNPVDETGWAKYPGYAVSVWDQSFFEQPDVVLIDGRFRVGCFLATAFKTERRVRVLFDDYKERKGYHTVERLLKPTSFVDRMAVFEVEPGLIKPKHLAWLVNSLLTPR